jgi:D-alanyl-D-alanine dipeptidase
VQRAGARSPGPASPSSTPSDPSGRCCPGACASSSLKGSGPGQQRYFEEYAAELRAAHPDWSAQELRAQASRYVSPPEIAPHSAGAAVDLTLVAAEGTELDMGTRVNATPEERAGACYALADGLSHQVRLHRATLSRGLTAAGLATYGTEWWHWSFGDRYWALMTGQSAALYGPASQYPAGRY